MIQEFTNCGDCECNECLKIHSCSEADYEYVCTYCEGVPPYAPWEEGKKFHEYKCEHKKPSFKKI